MTLASGNDHTNEICEYKEIIEAHNSVVGR